MMDLQGIKDYKEFYLCYPHGAEDWLIAEVERLTAELNDLKPKHCDLQTLHEVQTYNAECAVELAQRYKDALEQILDCGFGSCTRQEMRDIAKDALGHKDKAELAAEAVRG